MLGKGPHWFLTGFRPHDLGSGGPGLLEKLALLLVNLHWLFLGGGEPSIDHVFQRLWTAVK